MNAVVSDNSTSIDDLFPFTLTRSVWDIRIGILTLREKQQRLAEVAGSANHPLNVKDFPLASSGTQQIRYPWDIFRLNAQAIAEDMILLTAGRTSQPIPSSVQAIAPENIFIEEGARIAYSILNASTGPIYIGRHAEIMEGSLIRGPFALCEGATVKMGTKIYGATTIGPYCVVGGEIKNSVLFGYSNKAHDGYLGDAVIGEWCNLGAGTSNSNLKNTGGEVKVWSQSRAELVAAGGKCGLLMGDYSRCSINTSFTTGAVVGVCCNILAGGLTPKYIPSFSWGQASRYIFEKALRDIANWKKFKNQSLTDKEIQVLKHIFEGS
jgi:UDP-N-acetylglucosamine diphosphorylase/glucosamine-1-phosphate N-acetyltransferase